MLKVAHYQPDSPFRGAGLKTLRAKGAALCHACLQNMLSADLAVCLQNEEMNCCSSTTGARKHAPPVGGRVTGTFIYSGGFVGAFSVCCNLMKSPGTDTCWSCRDCTEDQRLLTLPRITLPGCCTKVNCCVTRTALLLACSILQNH